MQGDTIRYRIQQQNEPTVLEVRENTQTNNRCPIKFSKRTCFTVFSPQRGLLETATRFQVSDQTAKALLSVVGESGKSEYRILLEVFDALGMLSPPCAQPFPLRLRGSLRICAWDRCSAESNAACKIWIYGGSGVRGSSLG